MLLWSFTTTLARKVQQPLPARESSAAALLPLGHRQDPHRLKITVLDYSSGVDLIISRPEVT